MARSYGVWLLRGWSRSFEWKRLCTLLFVVTPLSAVCGALGHGVLMLVVFVFGFWPFPYRARWTLDGLEVSWLLVRETLRFADIEAALLQPRVRAWGALGYEVTLEIALRDGRRAVVVAPRPTLERLHSDLSCALAARTGGAVGQAKQLD